MVSDSSSGGTTGTATSQTGSQLPSSHPNKDLLAQQQMTESTRSEECVLGSGTVPSSKSHLQPSSYRGSNEKQSMLKTTSPKLQLTTKTQSKQTVMVPHYMLDNIHSKAQVDPFSHLGIQGKEVGLRVPAAPTPTKAPIPATTKTPVTSYGITPQGLTSSQNSYFSVYGETPTQESSYSSNYTTPSRSPWIQKPKHKYPFQFLHQVFLTGSAIMAQNLKEQHPNLRPECYNEVLAKSNFNPYTYFEYISQFEGFERKLEQFYRARPDIAEKCKTRDQKLAEKRASTSSSRTMTPHSYAPAPLSRIHKDPPSLPRAPPTIIESAVIPSKKDGKQTPHNTLPQPITISSSSISSDLKLTKPSIEPIKSPQNYSFKSPTYPHAKISESPSPAKRTESSLQYHHLSVDSFRQDSNKSKMRRKNTSSQANTKLSRAEPEKISPTKEPVARNPVPKVTEDPDVTEAAMAIMQLMQKKGGDSMPKTGRVDPLQHRADDKGDTGVEVYKDYHQALPQREKKDARSQFYTRDYPKHPTSQYKGEKDGLDGARFPRESPRSVAGEKRPPSSVRSDHRTTPSGGRDNLPPNLRNTSLPNLREPSLPLLREAHNDHVNDHRTSGIRDSNPPVLKEYNVANHLGNHIATTRESQGQAMRQQASNRSRNSSGSLDKNRSREPSYNSELGRDRQVSGNNRGNHHHHHHGSSNPSSNKPSDLYHASAKAAAAAKDHLGDGKHSHKNTTNSNATVNSQSKQHSGSHSNDKMWHSEKGQTPPKMPDLNKQPIDNMSKTKELQNELKSGMPNAAKPPLLNPRTPHIITTASIPPPELKKARNFELQTPTRDLPPSQPPEMRIAPAHSSVYLPQPVNNRPDNPKKTDFNSPAPRTPSDNHAKKHEYNGRPEKKDYLPVHHRNSTEHIEPRTTKIEVKTTNHTKKHHTKDNSKLQVVTKPEKHDRKVATANSAHLLSSANSAHLLSSANLAYKFDGSPGVRDPYGISPEMSGPGSPELTIADDTTTTTTTNTTTTLTVPEKAPRETVRAVPDSSHSRPSPDSSSSSSSMLVGGTVVTLADSSNLGSEGKHNGTGMLGYVLEDVSPPSTSPQHHKRDISKEGLMNAFMNNNTKRRKTDPTPHLQLEPSAHHHHSLKYPSATTSSSSGVTHMTYPRSPDNHTTSTPSVKPGSKTDVLVARYLSCEPKIVYPKHEHGTAATTGNPSPAATPTPNRGAQDSVPLDERPIQSQHLSSSCTELSEGKANKFGEKSQQRQES